MKNSVSCCKDIKLDFMENVKNNFEEMKKLLLGALEILEQTSSGLVERIQELEGRVEVLEERVKELEQHAVADIEAYAPTASLFAASAAEVNDEVEETSETEIFEAEQAEAEQVEQVETEQAEAGQADQAELEEAEQEDQLQEQPMESEEQPVDSQEQSGSAEAEHTEQPEPAEAATAESYEFAEVEQFEEAEQFEEEQQLDGEQQVLEFEAAGVFEAGTGAETETESESESESVGSLLINDFVADEPVRIVNEAAKPDWYDWEVDYPAEYVDDVYKGISFNDRYEFIKELFNVTGSLDEAEMAFKETLDTINSLEHFKQGVAYIRERFPMWDEQSDEVYRFYMAVRRKFNK